MTRRARPSGPGGWRNLLSQLNVLPGPLDQERIHTESGRLAETREQSVLRQRLRAVAVVLFVARLAWAVRAEIIQESPFSSVTAFLLCVLVTLFFFLRQDRGVSFRTLRLIEYAVFFGMSLDFSVSLNQRLANVMSQAEYPGGLETLHVVEFVSAIKDHIFGVFALMMIYGMFIPGTGLHAAAVVLLIACLPGTVIFSNKQSRQGLDHFRRDHITAVDKLRSSSLLSLAAGACCAIYGTMVINQLRQRAQSAEELGQYRLRQRVGSGGMGDVYLAEHRLLRRLCAVKLIRSDQAEDPVMLGRFEQEVRATASLTHWNTIQVFDYGRTDDGRFFYVMEFLSGRNLSEIVERFGRLPEDRAVFILEQVCEALRESASKGLVHRDIKPSNIFLASLGGRCDVAKLLDFGLVRPLASLSAPEKSERHQINGSPRFMCPEQALGKIPDVRGDLYSLGAVAYFLLSGRPPFDSDNPLQLVIAHATREPPAFDDIGVTVSKELAAVVMRCLRKDPAERYSSPDALLSALQDLPQHGRWTWAMAEHWWRKSLPECLSDPVAGLPSGLIPARTGSGADPTSATDPTLIGLVPEADVTPGSTGIG